MSDIKYHNLVKDTLQNGNFKENRTGVSTISQFNYNYEINLQDGFPLLTTKKMDGSIWESLVHELLWYLSGEEHIRNLREHTSIWDKWADDNGGLETAYGRFWRRYPVPSYGIRLDSEAWPEGKDAEHTELETGFAGISQVQVFDQIDYVIKQLKKNPNSRRLVVSAWHPANAANSKLPPCHYSFVFNVQNGKLNCHLSQRSADIAVGVPFNIGSYALLTHLIASETGLEVGKFAHSLVDAHIYCGKGKRAKWYQDNLDRLGEVEFGNISLLRRDITNKAPGDNEEVYDHIPNLLKQINRLEYERPEIEIADKPLSEIEFEDIQLNGYEHRGRLRFGVAE